jgi:hypothetical protein
MLSRCLGDTLETATRRLLVLAAAVSAVAALVIRLA